MVSWFICTNIIVVLLLNNILGCKCANTSTDTTNLSNSSINNATIATANGSGYVVVNNYSLGDNNGTSDDSNNSSTDVVLTLLIPAQTAIIEALIFAFKSISGSPTFCGLKTETQTASFNVLATTCIVLSLTLSICNAVLNLSKAQKISGSIALVTQAAIVMSAQLKNINNDKKAEMSPVTPQTDNDINRVLKEKV